MNESKLLSKKWTSCPGELSDIRRNITDICQQLAYSEQQTNEIVLAIDEACTNIIRYAYQDCRDGVIQIEVSTNQQQVIFKLYDFAKQVSKDCINLL